MAVACSDDSHGVVANPEIKSFKLNEDHKFVVMASDGVWEFISSQEAVNIVNAVCL